MIAEVQPEQSEPTLVGKVNAALESCKGNVREAASLLGLDYEHVRNLVRYSPLLARWYKPEPISPPDDLDGIARQQINPEDERLAWAIEMESLKFGKLLARTGLLSEAQVQTTRELQALASGHMSHMMEFTNASLTILMPILLTEIKTLEARLAGIRKILDEMGGEVSEERIAKVDEEKSVSAQLNETVDTMRKIKAATDQGAMNAAVIKYRLRNGANAKRAKPGFSPIDVQPLNES